MEGGAEGVVRQRERGLTSSIAFECSPIPGACVSTFCIASAASQLSAHGRAGGWRTGRKETGEPGAQRTVVERVDHVVHNPERLVAVEGPIDCIAVRCSVRHGGRFSKCQLSASAEGQIERTPIT